MKVIARSVICRTTVSLVVAAGVLPATAGVASSHDRHGEKRVFAGELRDLQPATAGPLDHASARLTIADRHGNSRIVLRVTGINRSAAGSRFGAHLHTGPCVAGDGAAAGPHYNTDVLARVPKPKIDRTTEVWLDFTVTAGGKGRAVAHVPFVPKSGDRSVVIHRDATDLKGAAGPRLACLPVER